MKILYICEGDHNNIRYWSGTEYHIAKTLSALGNEIVFLDNIKGNLAIRATLKLLSKLCKKQYKAIRDPINLKCISRYIRKKIGQEHFDVIFTTCTPLLAYLDIKYPMVVYTDTSFAGWLSYCDMFSPLSKRSVKYGNYHEGIALRKCSSVIYSSHWGKETACSAYGLNPSKVKIIPFGANLTCDMSDERLIEICEGRMNEQEKRLLFVGYNWVNKGGETALEAVKCMNQRGMKAKLMIVGCRPEIPEADQEYVEIYGFLDKNIDQDREKLMEIYARSSLFVLPTKFDCTPIVLAEAASFALPVLATDTCGVADMMRDHGNGFLMPYGSSGQEYAQRAFDILSDSELYLKLCKNSRKVYQDVFNWKHVGRQLQEVLEELL